MTLRVAVTRPEPQASDTAMRLADAGYEAVKAPLLRVRPSADPGSPVGVGCLALTSRTAAMILADHPAFHGIPVFAVGDATAREALRAGFTAVTSGGGDVTALFHHLETAPEPIVHLCGADHTGDLVERLVSAGKVAERRVLYCMEPAGALPALPGGAVDCVLLYSPRTAALYAERAPHGWRTAPCIALSAAVAKPVARFPHVVAARPDEDALLEALAEVAAGRLRPTAS